MSKFLDEFEKNQREQLEKLKAHLVELETNVKETKSSIAKVCKTIPDSGKEVTPKSSKPSPEGK